YYLFYFFSSSRRRHTRFSRDWSSDVCLPISATRTSPTIPTGRSSTWWAEALRPEDRNCAGTPVSCGADIPHPGSPGWGKAADPAWCDPFAPAAENPARGALTPGRRPGGHGRQRRTGTATERFRRGFVRLKDNRTDCILP